MGDGVERAVYAVVATPWAHGYELNIVGVGVTQTHDDYPETAEEMVRDCIAAMRDVPVDSFDVEVTYRGQDRPTGDYGEDL